MTELLVALGVVALVCQGVITVKMQLFSSPPVGRFLKKAPQKLSALSLNQNS